MLFNRNPSLLQGVPPHREMPAKATVAAMRFSLSCTFVILFWLGFSVALCGSPDRAGDIASTPPAGTASAAPPVPFAGDRSKTGPAAAFLSSATPVGESETCLVCGRPAGPGDLAILHEGRRVVLHRGACAQVFAERPDAAFASLRPRGALFQEAAEKPSVPTFAWLGFGLYVVSCLLTGGACAYLAVGRGRPAVRWFFAGLLLNVGALAVLSMAKRRDTLDFVDGPPSGLAKVALTRGPRSCPTCASPNHPAARRCSDCRRELTPAVASEAAALPGATMTEPES